MCLQVMRVANESNVGTHVLTYASRARQTPGAADDVLLMAKTNVLVGLAHLKAGKYADAASSFLKARGTRCRSLLAHAAKPVACGHACVRHTCTPMKPTYQQLHACPP